MPHCAPSSGTIFHVMSNYFLFVFGKTWKGTSRSSLRLSRKMVELEVCGDKVKVSLWEGLFFVSFLFCFSFLFFCLSFFVFFFFLFFSDFFYFQERPSQAHQLLLKSVMLTLSLLALLPPLLSPLLFIHTDKFFVWQ